MTPALAPIHFMRHCSKYSMHDLIHARTSPRHTDADPVHPKQASWTSREHPPHVGHRPCATVPLAGDGHLAVKHECLLCMLAASSPRTAIARTQR